MNFAGKFVFNASRDIPLSVTKYGNYYKVSNYDSEYEDLANVNQPQVLIDDVAESLHEEDTSLPQKINLISSKEVMKKKKVQAIVRFHKISVTKEPEKCVHHSLILYFPWKKESDLLGNDGRYSSKLGDQFVKETVARNRLFLEPYCEEVETAQELLQIRQILIIFLALLTHLVIKTLKMEL